MAHRRGTRLVLAGILPSETAAGPPFNVVPRRLGPIITAREALSSAESRTLSLGSLLELPSDHCCWPRGASLFTATSNVCSRLPRHMVLSMKGPLTAAYRCTGAVLIR
ncbi:unnamed protein product [Alternaria burnsii]|nr:unnamed protein product [Alternaria burnsii]